MKNSSLLCSAALGAVLVLGMAGASHAQDLGVKWKGAPEFSNDDVKFKVRGRVYMDYAFQDIDGQPGGTADNNTRNSRLRTARLGVEGAWNTNWAYKAEVNFTGGAAQWEDLILEYKPDDSTSVMVGNFKTVSLENITSSRYITFMERGPFNDVLDVGRVMNIAVKKNGANWTAMAAVSMDSVNNADVAGEERIGVNGRVTFAPINEDETKLHLGAWGRYRDLGDEPVLGVGDAGRYRLRNNTNVGDRFTDSGSAFAEKDRMFGAEAALVWKNFSLQGEYAYASVDKRCAPAALNCTLGADEGNFSVWYAYASFFPTGEKRNYSAAKGEFERVKILNPVTAGGMGAFELGVRYDSADLNDLRTVRTFTGPGGPVNANTPLDRGGQYSAWTVGATWYPFTYVRFMANYTKAQNDNPSIVNPLTGAVTGSDLDVDVDTLQFRAQFDF